MKAFNLTSLAVETLDNNSLEKYIQILTDNSKYKIKTHEIKCIKAMLENVKLSKKGISNYYYSYDIPQIGKEFDLLKFDENSILNIELKSKFEEVKIIKQLELNNHYLSFLPHNNKYIFAFCLTNNKFYKVNDDKLIEVDYEEVINIIEEIELIDSIQIDQYFKPNKYLISPLNNTTQFLKDNYYLTPQQENIKKEIIELISRRSQLISIQGKAGTGKTLLLYDLAKTFAKNYKVCVIHCGIICEGQKLINKSFKQLDIISAKDSNDYDFSQYSIILIDECHRIYKSTLKHVLSFISSHQINCILCGDDNQKLSTSEESRIINEILKSEGYIINYKTELTNKIRTNPELHNFIQLLFDKSKIKKYNFNNVQILYADNQDKLKKYISEYESLGYRYISYTPSRYIWSNLDDLEKRSLNTHHVIGQEFDSILVHIDNNFYYTQSGKLKSKNHPNPDYIYFKLLYQALTRAREKITLVVVENTELLLQIFEIFERNKS